MIKLHGHPLSTCTRKVLTTLAETNTPYEMVVVDFATSEHKKPPHLARQPFGQIPAIDDDGFELYESRAIARYLDAKAGSPLTPKDLKQRALMDQFLSVEQSNFSSFAMKFIFQHVFSRPQEEAALEAAHKALDTAYAVLDKALAKTPYLAGAEFTLADIGYMPYIEYLAGTPAHAFLQKYPSALAWWERIRARPSWKKVTGR